MNVHTLNISKHRNIFRARRLKQFKPTYNTRTKFLLSFLQLSDLSCLCQSKCFLFPSVRMSQYFLLNCSFPSKISSYSGQKPTIAPKIRHLKTYLRLIEPISSKIALFANDFLESDLISFAGLMTVAQLYCGLLNSAMPKSCLHLELQSSPVEEHNEQICRQKVQAGFERCAEISE